MQRAVQRNKQGDAAMSFKHDDVHIEKAQVGRKIVHSVEPFILS